jgi:hypothetical protein
MRMKKAPHPTPVMLRAYGDVVYKKVFELTI